MTPTTPTRCPATVSTTDGLIREANAAWLGPNLRFAATSGKPSASANAVVGPVPRSNSWLPSVVAHQVQERRVGEPLVHVEVERPLEGVARVEEDDVLLPLAVLRDERREPRVAAVRLPFDHRRLDVRVEIVRVEKGDLDRLLRRGDRGGGEKREGTEKAREHVGV